MEINYKNPIFHTDFYKTGHLKQYPEGTEFVYSNFTPRSDKIARRNGDVLKDFDGRVVNFGLQGIIVEFLIESFNEHFFGVSMMKAIEAYQFVMDSALGPNVVTSEHLEELWEFGSLPLEIKALPEGARVPVGVPLFTIINTDERFYWLVNYLETVLSSELWQSCTSATIAYEYKRLLSYYANKTGVPPEFVAIQGHDFSFRGLSSRFSAVKSAIGHLTSFIGTDTIPAIPYLMQYYGATNDIMPIGVSVPATEHSVMCLGGQETEIDTVRRLIVDKYNSGVISVVSDTWDYWQLLTKFTTELKPEILAREADANGLSKVVFRPDSGNPVDIICGLDFQDFDKQIELGLVDKHSVYMDSMAICSPLSDYNDQNYLSIDAVKYEDKFYSVENGSIRWKKEIPCHVVKGSVEVLWDIFEGNVNDKGYKELNDKVGLIYGDSITISRAEEILRKLEAKGFASSNIVFGIGSYTYQYNTRDTFGFAMKATWGVVNGEEREIFKDPKTDDGTKKSAKGLLSVGTDNEYDETINYVLVDQCEKSTEEIGYLETIFLNGKLIKETSLQEVRDRLESSK